MHINTLATRVDGPSFGFALTSAEEKDFTQTQNAVKKALKIDGGTSLFKIFTPSLPQVAHEDTGIGKLNSDAALEYLKFMKLYTGVNATKEYPIGEMPKYDKSGYFGPYLRCTTALGEDNINLFKLTTKEYGSILPPRDAEDFVVPSLQGFGYKNAVNFENELAIEGKSYLAGNFRILEPLMTAYGNMKAGSTPEISALKEEFEEYKKGLTKDFYERLALYPYFSKNDDKLFVNFENSPEKQARFETYKNMFKEEIEFFKFRKFLAQKNHIEAKEAINKEGLELYGDCPIGFSPQEVWAFPDAFYPKNITPGWGFRAINYEQIPQEGTAANALFREKISLHLKLYDGIRFDVGWQYFKPNVKDYSKGIGKEVRRPIEVGDGILRFIEKTAREIKGEDYDTKKLMYESDASSEDYQMFDWSGKKPVPNPGLLGRVPVLTTQYEKAQDFGWGNPQFLKKVGVQDYMIGTNNHDGVPLRALAEDDADDKGNELVQLAKIRKGNIDALKKSLNLSKEETKALQDPKNFVKAKFAEIFTAKNQFVFFNDVMGYKKRTDSESDDVSNYRIRVDNDYESEYHTVLQNNNGFNLMESLRIAMKSKGLDVVQKELYDKVAKYSQYLTLEGAKTREEAELAAQEGHRGFKGFAASA